jgi:hypothetical protein
MSQTLTASPARSKAVATAAAPATYPFFPDNIECWFEAKRAFGASSYGASEFGEVMATLDRITSGDYESWYSEWNATAERVFAWVAISHHVPRLLRSESQPLLPTTEFTISA